MTDSPALCPRCGSMLSVREAEAGLYLACDEIECFWMSTPIAESDGEGDLEAILRTTENDPDE